MRIPMLSLAMLAVLLGCAHAPSPQGCHIESGWLDATNGCAERAGFPDCYRVCPDGTRVRVQDVGKAREGDKAQDPSAAPH